jgi:hypothetical protein
MAPHIPSSNNTGSISDIPTAKDVTTSGGVWAPTSAKREKLKELQGELTADAKTLDDVATQEERLDLYLTDGLAAIVSNVEQDAETSSDDGNKLVLGAVLQSIDEILSTKQQLTQTEWETALTSVARILESRLATIPSDRCLHDVRDFYVPPVADGELSTATAEHTVEHKSQPFQNTANLPANAQEALLRFRLLLALAATEHLKKSWLALTTVSDQDIDRSAVTGTAVDKQAKTLDSKKLQQVLTAFIAKGGAARVEAMWNLMDRDGDGMLDESEMNQVCLLTVEPVRTALSRLFQEALDAYPVRAPYNEDMALVGAVPKPMGWRQRRREAKEKKRLIKKFNQTIQAHFVDEVEMPHRMRCIYAWANKKHQENKIDSFLVDDAGWSGRKRFVEL